MRFQRGNIEGVCVCVCTCAFVLCMSLQWMSVCVRLGISALGGSRDSVGDVSVVAKALSVCCDPMMLITSDFTSSSLIDLQSSEEACKSG